MCLFKSPVVLQEADEEASHEEEEEEQEQEEEEEEEEADPGLQSEVGVTPCLSHPVCACTAVLPVICGVDASID